MGTFSVTIEIGPLQGGRWEPIEAVVDTASTLTKVPRQVLSNMGIRPTARREARLANGQTVQREIGNALIRLNGEENANPVSFGEPGEDPLLGAVTLESFGLAVDPVNHRLIPVPNLEL